MFKKSNLVLSTIAVVGLSTTQALLKCDSCDWASGLCNGYLNAATNAAFVDCWDANGVLVHHAENFYPIPLTPECGSANFTSFNVSLNGTAGPIPGLAGNATIDYCDYFEVGTGYQFTNAGEGPIGLVVLQDRVGAARDLYYKSLTNLPTTLQWDWAELAGLV
jgi:hypothetical protein